MAHPQGSSRDAEVAPWIRNRKAITVSIISRNSISALRLPGITMRHRVAGPMMVAAAVLLFTGNAFAQSTIGAQLGTMAQEATTAGGNLGSMAMYTAALICLIGGAWAIWQSRQPQNREGGRLGMGVAGLVLCGLFASGGVWIGKAAQTTSGGAATITGTNTPVTFN